ncbi:MAG: helicase-associated domain-containing protein [Pseudonocardia sp.]|nr:helicase-associated domain-containing protein [Pseudonocardia sp.]
MSEQSFASHLAGLDPGALTALLEHRPDALLEPAPRSFAELAQRLGAVDSLAAALERVDADEVAVVRAVALGAGTVAELAARCHASVDQVRGVVAGLDARGLAWPADDRVGLPTRLAADFAADVHTFLPLSALAGRIRVDDLRTAVEGLGGDAAGLRKAELVDRLTRLYADTELVARRVDALPAPAREHLDLLAGPGGVWDVGFDLRRTGPTAVLVHAGLLLQAGYGPPVLPREVVLARVGGDRLRGRPELAASTNPPDDGRAGAEAALLALTTLLDEARHRPLAALKKGGIGARERARLSGKVGIAEPALWIDVATAAGFLARATSGYGVAAAYEAWREETAARRWAAAALAWFALDVAPTSRETDDGEVPPPEPMVSAAGLVRRALLRAAAGGRSLRAATAEIGWFCPLHPYDATGLERKAAAAVHEATLLGVVVGDRLSAVGEHLVALAERSDAVDALGTACAGLLPDARNLLVLQSDLTAVVSGQPSAAAARLLAAAAVPEARGVATTWRFSPASVRSALDAGWTVEELTAELAAVTDRALPQPLEYLIADVARRHGAVRVRGARCVVTGSPAEVAEILATRSLRTLHLSRLAPTVLACPFEPDEVVSRLRTAGFAPMPEDGTGAVIVPDRAAAPARAVQAPTLRARRRVTATELATRLRSGTAPPVTRSHAQLSVLAPQLDDAEVALLADALDNAADVRIAYRNRAGNRSVRTIRPEDLYDRWVSSWCHLRGAQREFAVSGIESVSPAG